jgi:hypothetical protein
MARLGWGSHADYADYATMDGGFRIARAVAKARLRVIVLTADLR